MTIFTTEKSARPGYFGKGRWGGIIDFAINRGLDYLEETEPFMYGELEHMKSAKTLPFKKQFTGKRNPELQTSKRRRSCKPSRSNQYCSHFRKRTGRLQRTKWNKQSSANWRRYKKSSYIRNF